MLAASLLALACSVVAVILAIDARDNSASPDEVAALEEQIAALQSTSATPTTPVDPVTGLPETGTEGTVPPAGESSDAAAELDDLQAEIDDLDATDQEMAQRITALEQDVEDLRGEIRRSGR